VHGCCGALEFVRFASEQQFGIEQQPCPLMLVLEFCQQHTLATAVAALAEKANGAKIRELRIKATIPRVIAVIALRSLRVCFDGPIL